MNKKMLVRGGMVVALLILIAAVVSLVLKK